MKAVFNGEPAVITLGIVMSNLLQLMKQLGADAALSAEYKADAKSVIARFKLTDEERDALLNHDYEAIKRLTGLKDGQFATNSTVKAYDS
ncbi:MAG: hypothetical protein ABIP56_01975 [Dokdonella sp.]